jgi:diacylglycerol kinase family enzyme
MVGVAGGDGTLSTAAEVLVGTEVALAPFPLGTLNHFARRLGISSLDDAPRAAACGRTRSIPLGCVAGRTFVNHASAGVYPRMVRQREHIRRWSGKKIGTVLASMHQLLHLEARPIGLSVEGVKRERTVPGIWVALGGAFQLPVDGKIPAGTTLEVVVPETQSRSSFLVKGLRALWLMRRGRPVQQAGVEVIRARCFTLEADEPLDISRDGEVERRDPPIEFSVHAQALRVVALAGFEDR